MLLLLRPALPRGPLKHDLSGFPHASNTETRVCVFLSPRGKAMPVLEMPSMRWWVSSESLRRSSRSLLLVRGARCRPRRMKQKRVRRDTPSAPLLYVAALLRILSGVCVCACACACVDGCAPVVGEEWGLFLDSATPRLGPVRCRENLGLGVSWLYGPWCHLCNYLNLAASLCRLPPILFEVVLKCLMTSFRFSQGLLDFQWNVMSYFSCGIFHFRLFVGALHNTYHSLFWNSVTSALFATWMLRRDADQPHGSQKSFGSVLSPLFIETGAQWQICTLSPYIIC